MDLMVYSFKIVIELYSTLLTVLISCFFASSEKYNVL